VKNPDVIVVGAGISGLSFAWNAARAGRRALVLEREDQAGGCICSHRLEDGFWYEMGAHTVYNSYGALLDIILQAGLADKLVRRGPARVHFGLLQNGEIDWLTPPKVLLRLGWLEAALHAPAGFFRKKRGRSVEQYYSGLVGPGNFRRILSPFFAAVPSQCADAFPAEGAGSLFKKRSRRKEFPRSFGLTLGLQTVCDAVAKHPNIEVRARSEVTALQTCPRGFRIQLQQGDAFDAPIAAVAVNPKAAAYLLRDHFSELAAAVGRLNTVDLESMGARVRRSKCRLKECAFVVPVGDLFFSAVSRDPFPDPDWRAFALHFRPGLERARKIQRLCELLDVFPEDLDGLAERRLTLPAPRIGHPRLIAEIQNLLENTGLALVGNYFMGLAIEDCIERSNSEWRRVSSR